MSDRRITLGFWAAIAFTAVVSLVAVGFRHRAEASNKAVTLACEYEVVESLAAAQGLTPDKALVNLKAQGVQAVVLSEDTIGQLISEGRATMSTAPIDAKGSTSITSLRFIDPSAIARVINGLQIRFGTQMSSLHARGELLPLPDYSPLMLRSTAIGLDPKQIDAAKRAGMLIIARYGNPAGVSAKAVRATLAWGKEQGVFAFLPLGDQVLGRKDALATTSKALKELGILYATPEFAKIGGDANMVAADPENVVRLHSAQAAELDKMTLDDAIERYSKAARERGMRILLLRPVSYGAEQPLSAFAAFAKEVGDKIRQEGGDMGVARPFSNPGVPKLLYVLIGLGVAATTWCLVAQFVVHRALRWVGAALLVLLAASCLIMTGTKLTATLAAVVFPLAAFVVLDRWRPKNPIAGLLGVSGVSLVGGLAIAGLMSTVRHMVMAEEFSGVKFAVFVPILLVGGYYFWRLTDWRGNLRAAITWGASGLFLALCAVFGLLIARTGNDTGVGASGMELQIRNALDALLYVRPRTKEFLFGHPFLVLGIYMLALHKYEPERVKAATARWSGWTAMAVMLGAVGQTDIVNTLCHGHIPVLLSVVRIFVGLAIGCILGALVWWAASKLLPSPREETPVAD